MSEFEKDKKFEDDEEFGDEEFEAVMDYLAELYRNDKGIFVANPGRQALVVTFCDGMKKVVSGEDVKITYKLNEPFYSHGGVRIRGKELVINNPKAFMNIAKFSDNMEIWWYLNGDVDIGFAFEELARRVATE